MSARIDRITALLADARTDLDRIALRLDDNGCAAVMSATGYALAHSLHSAIEAAQSRLAVMREIAALEVESRSKAMASAHQVSARLDTGAVFDQPDPGDETPEVEDDGFVSVHPKPDQTPQHRTWIETYVA